jgi:hypothetical protein
LLFKGRYSRESGVTSASWLSRPHLMLSLGVDRPTVLDYWHALDMTPTTYPWDPRLLAATPSC